MRAWYGKSALVFGLFFLAIGVGAIFEPSFCDWTWIWIFLVFLALALPFLNQVCHVAIDENGISKWSLLRGKRRILWSQVREIGIGGSPNRSIYRRELSDIYVAPRELTDAERVQVMNCRDAISIPYYGGKRYDLMRAAVLQYYPGGVPPMLRMLVTMVYPTYIVRREAADGRFTEEYGEILNPEQLYLEVRGW